VVLNKRVSITDQTALKDAKRSLSAMIYDFLLQHGCVRIVFVFVHAPCLRPCLARAQST
jgi:hypothetical protein